jgi:hypothetical protein
MKQESCHCLLCVFDFSATSIPKISVSDFKIIYIFKGLNSFMKVLFLTEEFPYVYGGAGVHVGIWRVGA